MVMLTLDISSFKRTGGESQSRHRTHVLEGRFRERRVFAVKS
jgi:hypothetical protein